MTMDQQFRSPRIIKCSWGCIEVEGQTGPFKDAKLFPGGARAWDWAETGTGHSAGVQPADVLELLDRGAEVIVLSRGVLERLKVSAATLGVLADRGVPVHVLPTNDAVRCYNELAEMQAVGGLFHTTC